MLGNLPGNLSRKLSWEFAKGNLLGKFSVIFAGHYLGICRAICHGNLLREFARKFSEILAGNLLVNSLGPLVLITDYYCFSNVHHIHKIFTLYWLFTSYLHHIYIIFTSYSHHIYIKFTSYSHHTYIIFTSNLHHTHIILKSNLHQNNIHTTFTSYLHHIHIVFTSY